MKTKISTLTIALATVAMSFTGLLSATTTLQVGTGYRQDSITSRSANHGGSNPRVKSHQHYRDLEIAFIGVNARTSFDCCCNSYLRAAFDYGWVLDGKRRHSLTFKDRESSDSFSHGGFVEEGDFLQIVTRNDVRGNSFVWDLDIGYIYPLDCGCSDFKIGPGVGFSVNRQHLHVKHSGRFGDSSSSSDFSESIAERFGLDDSSSRRHGNRHRTSWWGPWVGFDFVYNSQNSWDLYGEVEFHFGRSRNHRTGFESGFVNNNNSSKTFWGPSFKLGSNYVFCQNWFIDASIYYSKFYSFSSRNHTRWATGNVRFDIGYMF